MTRAKEIRDLKIDEVSLVDKGANQHARTVIAKRHDVVEETTVENYFNEDGDLIDLNDLEAGDHVWDESGQEFEFDDSDDGDYEDEYEDEFEDEEQLVTKGAGQLGARFGSSASEAAGAFVGGGRHGGGVSRGRMAVSRASNKAFGNGKNSRKRKAAAGGLAGVGVLGAGGATYAGVKKSYADEVREELSKALTDQDRDDVISKALGQVEYFAEIAKAAQETAEDERDMRLTQEYTEIAKGYNVPVHPEDLGHVLKRLAEVLTYDEQMVIKKCLDATSASEELFEEYGNRGGGDNADILQQVDALVDGSVYKGNFSREDVVSKVFEENPDAYDQYLAERY